MSNHPLGHWAVIDLETSGIDPSFDSIIDIGFLQFDGVTLVKKYSSLVFREEPVSQFIQKLTGITQEMIHHAPKIDDVIDNVLELEAHNLVAHNAEFEQSFLSPIFEKYNLGNESYQDTLFFLPLLFPEFSSLGLEQFIIEWNIAAKEEHRGLSDSIDLLKVILTASLLAKRQKERYLHFDFLSKQYGMTDSWFYKLFKLSEDELLKIANSIEFNLLQNVLEIVAKKTKSGNDHSLAIRNWKKDFNSETIKEIFSCQTEIKEILPIYTPRQSQIDMALKIGQSFKNGIHSLIQAPTGTGKTLAYLIPSFLYAKNFKDQILIATGTKTLQEQVFAKDISTVKTILGADYKDIKVAKLIGSKNHLCELIFRGSSDEEQIDFSMMGFADKFVQFYFDMVFAYNQWEFTEKKITRLDIPYVLKKKLDSFLQKDLELAVDFRSCMGVKCKFCSTCTYMLGLKEARDARIIIANHALVFTWPKSFPRPVNIIIDEAHRIEHEATQGMSLEISLHDWNSFLKQLEHLQGVGSLFYLLAQFESGMGESTPVINKIREESLSVYNRLKDHFLPLMENIERLFKKLPRYSEQYWNEIPMCKKNETNDKLAIAIINHFESIAFILKSYRELLYPYSSKWEASMLKNDNQILAFSRFEAFFMQLVDLEVALAILLEGKDSYAHSLKFHAQEGFVTLSSPIDIGKSLAETILNNTNSVVFTSATLANATGESGIKGMEWVTGYLYTDPKKRFKSGTFLPAVYDYQNKARVFLCSDTPSFKDYNFVKKVLTPVMELIERLDGRSLLLFSAKTRFEEAREILLSKFSGSIPVFVQGMGHSVVEDFKKNGKGILIGMESFGEGIDLPGDILQFVFIDKVPDLRQDLVIEERRKFFDKNIGNEFSDYYLAHRTRSLHQKLGRLLRTENDFGGAIIVDSRCKNWNDKTKMRFEEQMRPYRIERLGIEESCVKMGDFILSKQ